MRDKRRRDASRMRAQQYAPRPESSWLMYGAIGSVLAALGIVALGRFYDVNTLAYPIWIAAALFGAFVASIALRALRSRRHAIAHRREYDKTKIE